MTKSRRTPPRAPKADTPRSVSFKEAVDALEQAANALDDVLPKHARSFEGLKIRTTRAELRGMAKLLRAKCYEFP